MRRSVMISPDAHKLVAELAAEFDVTQPEIVEAALDSIDRKSFKTALNKLSKEREVARQRRLGNRRKLAALSKEMTDDQIEALLKKAGK